MRMLLYWICLFGTLSATLLIAAGGLNYGSLMFALFSATVFVALASFIRYLHSGSCSVERAAGIATVVASIIWTSLLLASAKSGNLNARIGNVITWVQGEPTSAGVANMILSHLTLIVWIALSLGLLRGLEAIARRLP